MLLILTYSGSQLENLGFWLTFSIRLINGSILDRTVSLLLYNINSTRTRPRHLPPPPKQINPTSPHHKCLHQKNTYAMVALVALVTFVVTQAVFVGASGKGAATTPASNFQYLNIREAISDVKIQPSEVVGHRQFSKMDEEEAHGKWQLKLIHRDAVSSTSFTGHRHRLDELLKRDAARIKSLNHRIGGAAGGIGNLVEDFGSDIISGMEEGSGEYFVRIGIGSPPVNQYMVIDSGSDIVWVQCQPCAQCYPQADPVFDPAHSATFAGVNCGSTACIQLENAGRCDGGCLYEVMYGDGSYTKGTLAMETLTFGRTTVRNVAIGCGHINRGLFVGASGLLGLGGGSLSFIGQLGGQTGGAFGYCLVSRGSDSHGSLVFGRDAIPPGAAWTSLLHNPRTPSFYYVGLVGLIVGGERVPVAEDVFRLTESWEGGVVIDTGTAVTRFPVPAYEALRDAFVARTMGLPRVAGVSIFDACYDLYGFEAVLVPTVSFYFSGGPILTLPARNFLIPVDDVGTFCFAFAPSSSGLSIIGNIQQEGIQVTFDGANGFVGFGPNTC